MTRLALLAGTIHLINPATGNVMLVHTEADCLANITLRHCRINTVRLKEGPSHVGTP